MHSHTVALPYTLDFYDCNFAWKCPLSATVFDRQGTTLAPASPAPTPNIIPYSAYRDGEI